MVDLVWCCNHKESHQTRGGEKKIEKQKFAIKRGGGSLIV